MAGFIPGFDVIRVDAHGFRVPVVTGTVTLENLTTIASPYTRAISADGVVAGGSLTGSPGDIIEVSHATYPETIQFTLTATQDEAYTSTQNAAITYVAENLDTRETPAKVGELFAIDTDNPTVPPIKIASIRPGETVLVPEQLLQSTVERNYDIKLVTQDELSQKTGFDLSTAATETLTIPPVSSSVIIPDHTEYFLEENQANTNAGFAAALTAIGSTPTTFVLTENITLSASHTVPSTCILAPRNGCKITISGSSTLTIGSFEDPGHVQCFAGVSSSNHVVFAAAAVSEFKLAWYVGKTGGSGVNCTYPMLDLMTSCTTNGGGVVKFLTGDWHMDDVRVPANTTLWGAGATFYGGVSGTWLKKYTASAGNVLNAGALVAKITYRDLGIDTGANANVHCWYASNTSSNSTFGILFENVSFRRTASSGVPLTMIDSSPLGWELAGLTFLNCHWEVPDDTTGFQSRGFNSTVTFIHPIFHCGSGDINAIDADYLLALKVITGYFGGTVGDFVPAGSIDRSLNTTVSGTTATATSGLFKAADLGQKFGGGTDRYIIGISNNNLTATLSASGSNWTNTATNIYRFGDGTQSNCAIRLGGVGNVSLDNCQFETFNYDVISEASQYLQPISFRDCLFQGQIKFEGSQILNSSGNIYDSLAFADDASAQVNIYSEGDSFRARTVFHTCTLQKAKEWGPFHAGTSFFNKRTGYAAGREYMTFGGRTEFTRDYIDGNPDDPIVRIGTKAFDTSTYGQVLLELFADREAVDDAHYGWNCRRSLVSDSLGYLRWQALQTDPSYNAWTLAFGIGYDHLERVNVTQITDRNTAVNLPDCHHGTITCYAGTSLGPGGSAIFQITNNLIQKGDEPRVTVVNGSTTKMVTADVVEVGAANCWVMIFNHSATTADTGTLKLNFTLWKGGGFSGITY